MQIITNKDSNTQDFYAKANLAMNKFKDLSATKQRKWLAQTKPRIGAIEDFEVRDLFTSFIGFLEVGFMKAESIAVVADKNVRDFSFLGNSVRVINKENEAWFVLTDVAKVIGHSNASRLAEALRENQRSNFLLGRQGNATIINESGLYRILLRSNKPEAEKFQIWVEDEVLPSIRKHGAYATPVTIDKMIADPDFAIKLLQNLKTEQSLRQRAEAEREQIANEKRLLIHSAKTYTATEIAKECGISSAVKFNYLLKEKGIHYKQNGTWVLYAKYAEMGLTEIKQAELSNGHIIYDRRFTGKGREFCLKLFAD